MHLAESNMAIYVFTLRELTNIIIIFNISQETGYDKRLLKKYSVMYG